MKVHPILAGILNGLVPGLSYLLMRERVIFGGVLLLAMIIFTLVSFTDPSPAFDTVLFAVSPTGRLLEGISYVLAVLAFGYDAYDLAHKKQIGTALIKV